MLREMEASSRRYGRGDFSKTTVAKKYKKIWSSKAEHDAWPPRSARSAGTRRAPLLQG
jgi:hypothetical protein